MRNKVYYDDIISEINQHVNNYRMQIAQPPHFPPEAQRQVLLRRGQLLERQILLLCDRINNPEFFKEEPSE